MKKWGIGALIIITVATCVGSFLFLSNPTKAETKSVESDLKVSVASVISLAVYNCGTVYNGEDSESLTLSVIPSPGGTFGSGCQNVVVDTNAPGFTLSAKANSVHPSINSGNITNQMIYQNPLPPNVSVPPTIISVAHSVATPGTITPNHWGFAVDSTTADLAGTPSANFDSTYIVNNASNKYAQMPITDTTVYTTNAAQTASDLFKFWYGVNLNHLTLAGLYQTTVTYTATANEIPLPLTYCGTLEYECIMYTIDAQYASTPGEHRIGTGGEVAGIYDHEYNWDVFVDDQPITDCGGGNNCVGSGWNDLVISVPTTGAHQIKILPHDGPEPGWGNAFSMDYNNSAIEIITIDAPLTTMAFAPKPSESTTDASYMFAYIFAGCDNLTTPAVIKDTYKLPNTITNLSSFMTGTHYGNESLTSSLDLSPTSGWISNNNSIIDLSYFMDSVHESNYQVITPLTLPEWSFNNVEDLSFFMMDAYYKNFQLATTIDLAPLAGWFNANNTVNNIEYFFLDTYYGVPTLSEPMDLSPLSGWFYHNSSIPSLEGFFYQVYTNYPPTSTNNITMPMDLRPLKDWFYHNETITNLNTFLCQTHWGSFMDKPLDLRGLENWFYHNNSIVDMRYFLGDVHLDDSHLDTAIDIRPLKNWFYHNNSVKYLDLFSGAHSGNTSLDATIDLTPLADWFHNSSALEQLTILNGTYYGNISLVQPADLSPLSGWFYYKTSNNNLSIMIVPSTHSGNASLVSPIDLKPLAYWFNNNETFDGVSFYNFTHYNNSSLVLSGQVLLPDWLKTAKRSNDSLFWNDRHNIERTFWMTNQKSGDSAEVKFMDGSVLSSLGTPTYPKYVYYNRTSILPPPASGW